MCFSIWAFIIGAILITMALLGTPLKRLPMSPGIIYLAIGYALGLPRAKLYRVDLCADDRF